MPADSIGSRRATELIRLAEFLDRHGLAENSNQLVRAAAQLRSSANGGTYSYQFAGLYFAIEEARHPVPRGVTGIRAELRVLVKGVLDEAAEDQYSQLAVNVVLTGTTVRGTAMFSWHLDRDDEGSKSVDLHPRYHFQHAGQVMRAREGDWGQSLLLDAPRFMHPPLDGLLAVDFVLGAYLAKQYRKVCLTDRSYTRLISTAQRRSWTGFVNAIASFREEDAGWHGRCYPYWPQVMPRL